MSANTTPTPTETPSSTPDNKTFLNKDPESKPEPKPDDKTPTEDKKPDPPAGAPEKYTDFTVPEGFKFDTKALEGVTAVFKDLNLPQEGAQKLVDFYAKNLLESAQAPFKAWADQQTKWSTEIADRFGDRADTVRANINSAINTALPPSLARNLRTALDFTGAGTNPDIVEALSILLRPHYEGTPVPAGGPSKEANKAPGGGPVSPADAIYGHLRK